MMPARSGRRFDAVATAPDLENKVEHSVRSSNAGEEWLRGLIEGLLLNGTDRQALIEVLEEVYVRLRDEGNEELADLVLGGVDALTGWGSVREIPSSA